MEQMHYKKDVIYVYNGHVFYTLSK